MKNNKWSLEDAQKLADMNPDSFYKPSKEEVLKLKRGNLVKLIFNTNSDAPYCPSAERMWVGVTKVNKKGFVGQLGSMPCSIDNLKYGDKIIFEAKHIIETDIKDTVPINPAVPCIDKFCLVTKNILLGVDKVGFLSREKSEYEFDSGWFITAGNETDEYMNHDENLILADMSDVLTIDNSILHLLESEYGSAYFRDEDDNFIKFDS
jgi:hypothetical protein